MARPLQPPRRPQPLLFLFAALLSAVSTVPLLHAADRELGRPLIRTFTRTEHKAHAQFHAPFQSPEGLMYFGNQLAVMEYDGRSWRVLKIPLAFTRALAPGPSGDIYVGDEEQLGVLARPDSGEPRFTSLLDLVPADAKPFGFVRDIRVWRGDIFFATDKNILRWRERDRTFRVWPFATVARHRLSLVGERLLLHRQGDALYEFDGENFRRLSAAPEFARAENSCFVTAENGRLLAGLGDRGLFLVAPDDRENDVREQLRRPAFSRVADLGVRYLPYSALEQHRESMARFGHGMKAVEAVARTLL